MSLFYAMGVAVPIGIVIFVLFQLMLPKVERIIFTKRVDSEGDGR